MSRRPVAPGPPLRDKATALLAALLQFGAASGGGVAEAWEPIGPANGYIFSLARDPFDPVRVLAGTYFGGVYRSTDGGLSWSTLPSSISQRTVFAITFDPNIEGVVYAGTLQGGLYRSEDGGDTWVRGDEGIDDPTIQDVAVDPHDSQVLLAATYTGVYKSTDTGATWALSNGGLPFLPAKTLAFDPHNEGVVFLGTLDPRGAFRSTDRGDTWVEFNEGMIGNDVQKLRFDTETGTRLYASSSAAVAYELPPGSTTWTIISIGLPAGPISDLIAHPVDSNVLYAATGLGVYMRPSGTKSWIPVYTSKEFPEVRTFRLLSDPYGLLLHAGNLRGDGLVASGDSGLTWYPALAGLQNLFVGAMAAVDAFGNSVIYAGTDRGVLLTSQFFETDGVLPWLRSQDFSQNVFTIRPHPEEPETLFAGTERVGVFKSTDWGLTWAPSTSGILPLHTRDLAQSPHPPYTLYAATSSGAWLSRDHGASWEGTELGIDDVAAVAADPTRPGFGLVGTLDGRVYKTTDDGFTFIFAQTGLAGVPIRRLAIGADALLYCITFDGVLYTSPDDGDFWTPRWPGGPVLALDVVPDPFNPSTVYLGTFGAGVFKSTDGGENWLPANVGLTNPFIFTMGADQFVPGMLYAGSWGSAFVSFDGGETWSDASAGLPPGKIADLVTDSANPMALWVSVEDDGIYRSTDGATSWTPIGEDLQPHGSVPIIQNPANPAQLFAGIRIGGVYTSTDGGRSWAQSTDGISLFVRGIAFDPVNAQTMYAGSLTGGMFKSFDGGCQWHFAGLIGSIILDVEVDPLDSQTVSVATASGVAVSSDGGGTWALGGPYGTSGQASFVLDVAIDPTNSTIHAVTGSGGGIWRSTDAGASWTPASSGADGLDFLCVVIDPAQPQTLYAGSVGGGVLVSEDGGANWAPITEGLFNKTVTSVVVDPVDHRTIYAGTEGGGVFRLVRP